MTRPVDVASLVFFRVAFGLIIVWEVFRYFRNGWIDRYFLDPPVRFSYYGFEWLARLPPEGMVVLFGTIGVAGAGIALGAFHRLSAAVFTLCFGYVFLLEQARYLNHFYLMVLLGVLLTVVPVHRRWSLDAWANPASRSDTVPAWGLLLLQFQVAVVYVYGGIAKLNADWLAGVPIGGWLARRTDLPLIGPALDHPLAPLAGAWGGLAFDLLIVPAVLWSRTRVPALLVAAAFHLVNNELFSLGVFPLLAFVALLLLCPPSWPRRLLRLPAPAGAGSGRAALRPVAATLLAAYVAVQVLVPLRHLLYPGEPNWTENGHQFAWHMKLRQKSGEADLVLSDAAGVRYATVSVHDLLPAWQADKVVIRPELLRQLAHHVAAAEAANGRADVEVRVAGSVSLNGRPARPLVDPDVDLASQPRRLGSQPWVVPGG